MKKKQALSIVIPCYNEEAGLSQLAQQLLPAIDKLSRKYAVEPIFVDDGSTDRTNELLHQHFSQLANVKIMKHEKNRNLGAALRTGFAQATGDLIAAFDSDCTYSPELIATMIEMMDEQTHIVTVSPYHPLGKIENVPRYRVVLSKGVSRLYKLLLNSGIYTHGAMVRVYRREVLEKVKFKSDDFLAVTELLVKARLQNYQIKELPTSLQVRQYGVSKMKLLKTIQSHLRLLGQIVLYKTIGKELP